MYRNGLENVVEIEGYGSDYGIDMIVIRNAEDFVTIINLFEIELDGNEDIIENFERNNLHYHTSNNPREIFGLIQIYYPDEGSNRKDFYYISSSYPQRVKSGNARVYAPFGFSLQKYVNGAPLDPNDFVKIN